MGPAAGFVQYMYLNSERQLQLYENILCLRQAKLRWLMQPLQSMACQLLLQSNSNYHSSWCQPILIKASHEVVVQSGLVALESA